MKYKWIVADCDGTLLRSDLRVSARTVRAVKEYVAAGGRFSLATGRMPAGALRYCKKLGIKGELICYQGALVIDSESEEALETTPIPFETMLKVGKYLEERGLYYHIYRGDTILYHKPSPYSVLYALFCGCKRERIDKPLTQFMLEQGEEGMRRLSIKLLMMESPRKIPADLARLKELFSDEMLINTSKSFLVEMVTNKINKGLALARLGERYGIKPEETIAIGDSSNDLEMIAYAGLGVAMGNACAELKERADFVAPTNDRDGVAFVVEKFGLGKEIER